MPCEFFNWGLARSACWLMPRLAAAVLARVAAAFLRGWGPVSAEGPWPVFGHCQRSRQSWLLTCEISRLQRYLNEQTVFWEW